MEKHLQESFKKWDEQTNDLEEMYIEMNNLYLQVERSDGVTLAQALRLRYLAQKVYGDTGLILSYWEKEFQQLPGWLDV